MNGSKVALNGFGLQPVITKGAHPLNNGPVCGWQESARLVKETGSKVDKVKVGLLTCRVSFAGARGKAMPEVEGSTG
jgi:hypothetical protein